LIDVKTFTAHNPTSHGVGRPRMIRIGAVSSFDEDQSRWAEHGRWSTDEDVKPSEQADNLVSDPATLRFAVGIFDAWADVQTSMGSLPREERRSAPSAFRQPYAGNN
jgi:hypothetical protein